MSSSRERGDVIRTEYGRYKEDYRDEVVRKSLEDGHKAIADAEYERLATIICNYLYPSLKLDEYTVRRYHDVLDESPLRWDWTAVSLLIDSPNADAWRAPPARGEDDPTIVTGGLGDPETEWRSSLRQMFASLESAAIAEGIVQAEFDREIPVFGYKERLGTWWLKNISYFGQSQLITKHRDKKEFTLFNGGTRNGKSTALQTEVEDHIANGNVIIDLHDQIKAENVLYDVEETREDLINVREEMGLPIGFDEEYPRPDLDVYVPLTSETAGKSISFNTETDEYGAKPFVIPASEIPKEALIMMIDTTEAQEKYLNSAIDDLHAETDDWSLSDLADKIREGDRVRDDVANRIVHAIRTLQNKGYIRDKQSQHVLDWEDVFDGSGKVKSFSAKFIEDKAEKQALFAYLLTKIRDERARLASEDRLGEFPTATLVMRELQKLAPASGKKSGNSRRANATSVSRDVLRDLGEDMGHFHLEIIADSQKFTRQLDADVRTHADRIYVFKGQFADAQDAIKARKPAGEAGAIAKQVADYDVGECAVVHHHGVNWPINAAPPRSMKLDSERYSSGFEARATVLDHEETREIPWDTTIPDRFTIGEPARADDDGSPDEANHPVRQFLAECTERGDGYVYKDYARAAYEQYALENGLDESLVASLGTKLKDYYEFDEHDEHRDGHRSAGREKRYTTYEGVVLTEEGMEMLDRAQNSA